MKIRNLLFIVLLAGCQVKPTIPNGIYVDFNQTGKVKEEIQKGNGQFLPAYEILIANAEKALGQKAPSVMDKLRVPPSGDKHDYLSLGPYWWPDTTKTDGLPYIRRDGVVNPETRGEYVDVPSKNILFSNVNDLGWAYYFSSEKKYAEKAVELLKVWFVNPETRMNPNLQFAQGIPGINDGRGIGIIDWSGIHRIISPLQILEADGMIDEATAKEIHSWFGEYLNWLLTSEYGVDEDNYFNNHGTWYDVQVVAIQIYLGKTEDAKNRLENKTKARIASQIEPDGSQPHELARTKSLGYSTMNLRGFLHLANMGQKLGVDLWNFKTEDGRGIIAALDYLYPFATGEKTWEREQLGEIDDALENLKMDFWMAGWATGNKKYLKVAKSIKNTENKEETLLYTLF